MAAGPPIPQPVPPAPPIGYVPYPPGYGPAPAGPWSQGPPPQWTRSVAPPAPPRPRQTSAMSGARLLAWTGGAVTLLGVVLLMVLAASRGFFSPPARLTAGTVLGVALIGLAFWLHRKQSARAGALALAATGFATLYLVVAAATAVYSYLDPLPALLIAIVVAGAALGIADRWRSELLATGATAGAAILAPVLTGGWLLVALVLVLQLAAVAVVLRRGWTVLMLVAAAGPVIYGMYVGFVEATTDQSGKAAAVGIAIITLGVALATAMLAARKVPAAAVAALVSTAGLPAVVIGAALGDWGGGVICAMAAIVLGAFTAMPGIDKPIRLAAMVAAVVAALVATVVAFEGSTLTIVLLGEAVAAAVAAGAFRSRFAMVVGLTLGGIGMLVVLIRDAPLPALVQFPARPYVIGGAAQVGALVTAMGIAVLVLALAGALLASGGRLGWIRPNAQTAPLWVALGLVGLYGAAVLVVGAALLIAPDRTGFTAGHAVVTVSWTLAALVLLARGISRPALRIAGMVLVGAAVAKLVLFDLTALDGLARVGAFLGAGLLLLAAGTRYARLVAEAEAKEKAPVA